MSAIHDAGATVSACFGIRRGISKPPKIAPIIRKVSARGTCTGVTASVEGDCPPVTVPWAGSSATRRSAIIFTSKRNARTAGTARRIWPSRRPPQTGEAAQVVELLATDRAPAATTRTERSVPFRLALSRHPRRQTARSQRSTTRKNQLYSQHPPLSWKHRWV